MAGLAFLQRNTDGTDTANPSIAGVNIGSANAARYVIVGICARRLGGGAATLNSATIGGISATIIAQGQADGNQLAWIGANVPTGTTATVATAWSQTMTDVGFATYTCDNIVSLTATDSNFSSATPPSYAIDCVAGGIILGITYNRDGGASCTWAGITEDYDDVDFAGNDWGGASGTFPTTQTNLTVSATWVTSSLPKMLVISLEVDAGTDYTQDVNEVVTLVDTQTKATAKALAEVVTLVDTQTKAMTKSLNEVSTLVDTLTANMFYSEELNEALPLNDVTIEGKIVGKTLFEAVTLVDTVRRDVTRILNETAVIVDTLSQQVELHKTIDEAIELVDSIAKQTSKSLNELIEIAESINFNYAYSRTFDEVATLVDSITRGANKVLNEAVALVDSLSRVGAFARTLSETVTLVEYFQGLINGINIRWIRKYASKAVSFTNKYATKTVTWVKKYLDMP